MDRRKKRKDEAISENNGTSHPEQLIRINTIRSPQYTILHITAAAYFLSDPIYGGLALIIHSILDYLSETLINFGSLSGYSSRLQCRPCHFRGTSDVYLLYPGYSTFSLESYPEGTLQQSKGRPSKKKLEEKKEKPLGTK